MSAPNTTFVRFNHALRMRPGRPIQLPISDNIKVMPEEWHRPPPWSPPSPPSLRYIFTSPFPRPRASRWATLSVPREGHRPSRGAARVPPDGRARAAWASKCPSFDS
ncbi:hypothetical protein FB451DRAFT_1552270, partial [Mycena latifolia]